MNLYMTLLTCIAESICGVDSAEASLQLFVIWLTSPSEHNVSSTRKPVTVQDSLALQRIFAPIATTTVRGSTERRVIRAVLCECFSWKELHLTAEVVSGLNVCRRSYWKGKQDYEMLSSVGVLQKSSWKRQRFQTADADNAIKSILASENVAFVSWGTKQIKVDGVYYDVPTILRRRTISLMFECYKKTNPNGVNRSTFYRLATILTHGEVQTRAAVDYVAGILLNDNFLLLERIIRDILPGVFYDLSRRLEILKSWLNYGTVANFESGLEVDGALCPRHQIKFGLLDPVAAYRNAQPVVCEQCRGLNSLMARITSELQLAGADSCALNVVKDCHTKMELFLGHRLRVLNQQRALEQRFGEMRDRCVDNHATEALVVIDFKMKAEPIYFREKTLDHYGKRGMSWHGAMVRFWTRERPSDDPVESKLYFDQISGGDNKQDKDAVINLFEALVISLKRILPHVSTIAVQSDNASCYQNALVILLLPIIGAAHGIRVARYIHTDTQDGKSMLDAHFARAMKKVHRYVQQGLNSVTPSQLVTALNSDGGIPDCVAEAIDYDQKKVQQLGLMASKVVKKLSSVLSRVNDAIYSFPMEQSIAPHTGSCPEFHYRLIPSFEVLLYSYSGVGDGIPVSVSFEDNTCTIRSDNGSALPENPLAEQDNTSNNMDETIDCDEGEFGMGVDSGDIRDQALCEDGSDSESGESTDDEACNQYETRCTSPSVVVGAVTGVKITTSVQIRRRARKWNRTTQSTNAQSNQHLSTSSPTERDISAYAKRALLTMKNAGDLGVIEAGGLHHEVAVVASGLRGNCAEPESQLLAQGWARRPAWGKMYGARYIKKYEDEVAELFQQGEDNNASKLGPARMIEVLAAKHPKKYDLPTEYEIRSEISKLSRKRLQEPRSLYSDGGKDGDDITGINDKPVRTVARSEHMEPSYTSFLENIVTCDPSIKPKEALNQFRAEFPMSVHNLIDKKITTKVASIKTKLKKTKQVYHSNEKEKNPFRSRNLIR